MFGHAPEAVPEDPLEPVDGVVVVVELEDGVVAVLDDEEPVAACVIAAAPPASVPVTAIVARIFRSGVVIVVSLLSVVVCCQ